MAARPCPSRPALTPARAWLAPSGRSWSRAFGSGSAPGTCPSSPSGSASRRGIRSPSDDATAPSPGPASEAPRPPSRGPPWRRAFRSPAAAAAPYASPAAGVVESVGPAAIVIRADGIGLPGTLTAGEATVGRLVVAVRRPDDELPVAAVDVGAAGAILVAGARIDVEALPRARAMGVRGVIVGGVVGRDLRSFAASEARQRAALHTSPPFALLVLDGFGT